MHFKLNKRINFEPFWNRLETFLESLQKIHVNYSFSILVLPPPVVCPQSQNVLYLNSSKTEMRRQEQLLKKQERLLKKEMKKQQQSWKNKLAYQQKQVYYSNLGMH